MGGCSGLYPHRGRSPRRIGDSCWLGGWGLSRIVDAVRDVMEILWFFIDDSLYWRSFEIKRKLSKSRFLA